MDSQPERQDLASGGADGTVRVWDVATHQQVGVPLTGHIGALESVLVNSVAFSPDGKTLASGSRDDTVLIGGVAYLIDIGRMCASAGRSLTRAEGAAYVPPGSAYRNLCP
ncbi:MAG: WD40 repeat domain-containing protein [Frankiaceae bacterium]